MNLRLLFPFTFVVVLLSSAHPAWARPNVIFVLTDNQGAWTLGCHGNADVHTPNIDRLAREGVRFTRAYANNPVCSPNRATLLTGLMPSQHGVHCYLSAGVPQVGEGSYCTIREFPSLPKLLKAEGYSCGLAGKWHLGGNLHPQEAFDDYWITMPHGATSTFFDANVIDDEAIRKEPEHLTRFWTRHALRFIGQQSKNRPFFLYLAYNGPYGLGPAQLKDIDRVPHMADYAGAALPSFTRAEAHPWLHNNKDYINNETCIRRYAAEMTTIDDGVGEILAKLKSLGLDDNTLVVFAGDNGWAGGQHGIWGMGDHTRPLSAFEHTMRVPLIWWWPGKIAKGITSDLMVSHRDFLPSMLDLLGLRPAPAAGDNKTGHSYASVLRGDGDPKDWDNTIYYEFETMRCIRTATMKWIERQGDEVDELYDLAADPDEQRNLAEDSAAAAQKAALKQRLDAFFNANAAPEFDLWHGGRSKAKLIHGRDK